MDKTPTKIVTRFAPSPTGFMHIGGVRTAIFAWLWAKKNAGTFILRIEDTDKVREVAGSVKHILESLTWIGIDWDYGPNKPGPFGSCIQSERLDTYKKVAQILIDKGLAYPDPYSEEEVAIFRQKAESEKKPFLFRDHRPRSFDRWDGTKPLRFKVPEIKRYHWHDIVRGDLEAGEEALDDFILIKSDGYPTYNFAHIIDDQAMGVTHVLRGDEFISSTPKFLSMYDALGIKPPFFATLPPIMREDHTKKLGKRDGAKDVLEYRKDGYLPQAFFNFLVLIGWNPGHDKEIMSMSEIIAAFDLSKVQKAGGSFDEEKLRWMNKQYMAKLSDEEYLERLEKIFKSKDEGLRLGTFDFRLLSKSLPIIRDRAHTFGDIIEMFDREGELGFVSALEPYDPKKLPGKGDTAAAASVHLEKIIDLLAPLADFSADEVKKSVWPYASEKGRGSVLWPMRFALTGREKSPDPFLSASILGKEETIKRLRAARALLG
jgi:glutamyl-tRNA synthetase